MNVRTSLKPIKIPVNVVVEKMFLIGRQAYFNISMLKYPLDENFSDSCLLLELMTYGLIPEAFLQYFVTVSRVVETFCVIVNVQCIGVCKF